MKTPYNNHGRSDEGRRDAVDRIHNVRFETSQFDRFLIEARPISSALEPYPG
jgi:hypothetical protein